MLNITDAHNKYNGEIVETEKERVQRQRHAQRMEELAEKDRQRKEREANAARKKHDADEEKARKKAEQEAKRREEADYKRYQVTLQQLVIDAINGLCLLPIEPSIKPKLWANEIGEKRCLLVGPDHTCSDVSISVVKDEITKYAYALSLASGKHAMVGDWRDYMWSDAQAEACFRRWRHITEPIPGGRPNPWGFSNDNEDDLQELVYLRHNIKLDIKHPTPVYDEFLSRLDDPKTLNAFCWSVTEPKSYRQQYLYLQGKGRDGKGSLARFMGKLLGSAYHAKQNPPKDDDKRGANAFYSKQLVVFTDLRNGAFTQSALLMGITGGDPLQVHKLYQEEENAKARCKIICCANPDPVIKETRHDLDRILHVLVAPRVGATQANTLSDDVYDARLWAEAPGILAKMKAAYEELCPDHGPIIQPQPMLDKIIAFSRGREASQDQAYREFAEENFAIYPADGKPRPAVSVGSVNLLLRKEFAKGEDRAAFKRWLVKQGCVKDRGAHGGRYWYGLGMIDD